jgi:hypothetical protein
MSRMSDLHADAVRVCQVIPIRPNEPEPPFCGEVIAGLLAERAALALMCAADMARGYRAEIICAAADGDAERVLEALREWMKQ